MLIIDKSRKGPVALAVGGALVAIALAAWLASGPADVPAPEVAMAPMAASTTATPATSGARNPLMPAAPLAPAEPIEDPASVFELGHTGGLIVDPSTVASLDRLHTSLGENPTPEDIAALEKQLRAGLPKDDAEKAIKLLQGYRSYNKDMREDVMNLGIPQTRAESDVLLQRMTSLQARHFDPASAEAMFGEQNKLSRAVLDAALVQMDAGLSNEQKKERLAAIRATVPEDQRTSIPDVQADPASAPAS